MAYPLNFIDNFLNKITMYRLMLYGLLAMAGYAIGLGFFETIFYNEIHFAASLGILMATCLAANYIFSKLLKAPTNIESAYITALILFFILPPLLSYGDIKVLVFAGVVAMASKYVLAIKKKHIFNPAALGALVLSLVGLGGASWWVSSPYMLPAVLILGLLMVRKIRRFQMFFAFIVVSFLSVAIFSLKLQFGFIEIAQQLLTSWPWIFFATIMFTEPLTTPPSKKMQFIYAALVGFLFGFPFQIGSVYATPELALIIGNIFSYLVSSKQKLTLVLKEKNLIAKNTYEFIFNSDQKLQFKPGQFLEWTLPHPHSDGRGNRRFFTVASSPTEETIKLGVKMAETDGSTFKQKLASLGNEKVIAGQLGGDFILPNNTEKKLAFIAGGIGITPFRSMIKYLLDKNEERDIVLFYSNKSEEEVAYKDLLGQAQDAFGLKTLHIVGKFIDEQMIRQELPDFKDRVFYLSGPHAMVENYKNLLLRLGVSRSNIKTDYFPGF